MLRFLYLLSFLICIKLSFCYDYIDEATEQNLDKLPQRTEKFKRLIRPKYRNGLETRQEFDYDRSPVEFDVASFIQPDEESLEEDEASMNPRNQKRRRISKSYDYDSLLSTNIDENKKRDEDSDYINIADNPADMNMNPPTFKETMNTKHLNYKSLDNVHGEKFGHEKFRNIYNNDQQLSDQKIVHTHEKKCTLKNLKFPFFSHNKSEPFKLNKNKKRKLFCFNSPRKDSKLPDDSKVGANPIVHYKTKRSYEERLCPACKKLFLANIETSYRRKKTPKKGIQNSRQFFQNKLRDKKMKNVRKAIVPAVTDATLIDNGRKKREDDRERQLKELEEVQRKIDNVEIRLPTFEKPAEKQNTIIFQ